MIFADRFANERRSHQVEGPIEPVIVFGQRRQAAQGRAIPGRGLPWKNWAMRSTSCQVAGGVKSCAYFALNSARFFGSAKRSVRQKQNVGSSAKGTAKTSLSQTKSFDR